MSNNIRLLTYQTDFVRPVLTPPLDSFFESLGRLHRAPVSSTEEAADGGVRQEAWHLCWQVTQEFPYLIYLYICPYQQVRRRLDPKFFGFWLTVAFRLYLVISV